MVLACSRRACFAERVGRSCLLHSDESFERRRRWEGWLEGQFLAFCQSGKRCGETCWWDRGRSHEGYTDRETLWMWVMALG